MSSTVVVPAPQIPEPVQVNEGGPKVILMGETGTGKSSDLLKLLDVGVTPFVIMLDDNRRLWRDAPPGLHWVFIPPAIQTAMSSLDRIEAALHEDPAKAKAKGGIDQHSYKQLTKINSTLGNFKCERCGEVFGNVFKWGPERALCFDSMTELNEIFMRAHIGDKPTPSMYDYGPPQYAEKNFVRTLALGLNCTLVMTAHPAKIEGERLYLPNVIGSKYAPHFARPFDELIYCYTQTTGAKEEFLWDTTSRIARTKRRVMPEGGALKRDWSPLFRRKGS